MGVVHKLKPEVREFIIEQKKLKPSLSCRVFAVLIEEKFKIKLSKSSINSIFKEAGLSMPVGRRVKHKKQKTESLGDRVKLALQGPVVAQEPQISAEERILQDMQQEDRLAQGPAQQAEEQQRNIQKEEEARRQEEARQKEIEEAIRQEAKLKEEAAQKAQDDQKKAQEEAARLAAEKTAEETRLAAEKASEETRLADEKAAAEEARVAAEKAAEEDRLAAEKSAEEARRKEEELRMAGLKEEQEKWARKAEEEKKIAAEIERKNEQDRLAQGPELKTEAAPQEIQPEVPAVRMEKESSSTGALPQNRISSGAILLRAVDYLIGGSSQINEVLCKRLNCQPEQMRSLTEALIFESLFEKKEDFSGLWSLIGRQYSGETLQNYSKQLRQIETIKADIQQTISNIFTEVRGVKISFPDNEVVYLDAQLHTAWSTAYAPSGFSDTLHGSRNYLNRYFFGAEPLVLFTAPGYDIPPKEFFTLLSNFSNSRTSPDVLTLYGNKLEDLENIALQPRKSYSVVFGLWPWQYTSQRKINKLGDFKPYHIESINRDLYLAEMEMELLQPSLGRSITLSGCAMKTGTSEKTRLAILSNNIPVQGIDKLAGLYLNRWPNLEEAFKDFSRKIELSTYAGDAQKFTFPASQAGNDEMAEEIGGLFANYVRMLDAYLRWYFLPLGYQQKDIDFTSENFYGLPVVLTAGKGRVSVKIQVEASYPYLEDLGYLIRRFNERQIDFGAGQLLDLENVPLQ